MRYLAILVGFLLSASPCFAAIAYDTSVSGGATAGSSVTYSAVVNTGDVIFVSVATYSSSVNNPISGVTYDGVALTQLTHNYTTAGPLTTEDIWELQNPISGTHNVVVSSSVSTNIYTKAVTYSGADTTNLASNYTTNVTSGTAETVTLTGMTTSSWAICAVTNNQSGSHTGLTGWIARAADSYEPQGNSNATVGSTSHTCSSTAGASNDDSVYNIVELKVAASAPVTTSVPIFAQMTWWW